MLAGCAVGKEKTPEENFFRLVEKDKKNDAKTVNWDGYEATMVRDVYDDPDTDLCVEVLFDRYEAEHEMSVKFPAAYVLTASDDSSWTFEDKEHGRVVRIYKIDLSMEQKTFDEDMDFREYDQVYIGDEWLCESENHKTYIGLKEKDGEKKMGVVTMFDYGFSDKQYCVEAYGLGMLSELRSDVSNFVNGLLPSVELDVSDND